MALISLVTDFGLSDEYVGVMKGVILGICPSATLVDITHEVAPQDLEQAAEIMAAAYPFFPPATIHVAVVDPGVGTGRGIVCLQYDRQAVIAPDNGIVSALLESGHVTRAFWVRNADFFRKPVSRTFHGRDIFAAVAGHLAAGLALDKLGPGAELDQLARLDRQKAQISGDALCGRIVTVDRFGNLITNIDTDLLAAFCSVRGREVVVEIKGRKIMGLSHSYQAAGIGQALAVIDSRNRLEIAVNQGNAARFFGAGKNDTVTLKLNPP